MWVRLIFHSFRRDAQKKAVAIAAIALATCLATFLLNWSLNLGDNLQRDLRAYGANIIITPEGDSLPVISGSLELGSMNWDRYLRFSDLQRLRNIFWTNQIVAYAPLLPQAVRVQGHELTLVGTEFGRIDPVMSLPKTSPYLSLEGSWPNAFDGTVAGYALAQKFGWKIGRTITLVHQDRMVDFKVTGIVRSGGAEDHQMFAPLQAVQQFTKHPDAIRQVLVSAMVTSENSLFYKYQRSPTSLTPKEWERYSCTPYITSVASDISKAISGSEARVVRQISKTEEKVVKKVNWLMVLVMLAGLIAAALAMTSTTTGMILERRKELALMKAIGSSNAFIISYLVAELLALATAGSILGYGLGAFLSVVLSKPILGSVFQLKVVVLPLVAFAGVLIVLAGSIRPLQSAMTLEPAQALKDL